MENLTNEQQDAMNEIESFLKRVDTMRVTESLNLDMSEVKKAYEILAGEKIKWDWLD